MEGHIKLDRKILSWEWYHNDNVFKLFVHLLLTANYKDGKWQGNVVKRGQVITGLDKLSKQTGLSVMQLRTSFDKLKLTGEITIEITSKYRIVTICKYDSYQSFNSEYNNQSNNNNNGTITGEQQASNKQVTANNNSNNNNTDNNTNSKINTGGENSPPPRTPGEVPGFHYLPDGRSYIEPLIFYKATDFNGLPEENLKSVTDYFEATKDIKVEPERIIKIWSVFKTQELTEQKPYRNREDVYRHFLNWAKKQSFLKGNKPRTPVVKKNTDEKIIGIRFVNDFSQCEMSDGKLQDLTQNEQDSARYNLISPNVITKK